MPEVEVIELSQSYHDIISALKTLEKLGFFPLNGSGSITLHYDNNGKLVKIVPQPYINLKTAN